MRQLRAWFLRLGGFFSKKRSDREFAQEMESHLQMHIDDNLRSGMTPGEARRNALIKLGGVAQAEEKYRERRGIPALETFAQDLRFAVRMLLKNPGFTFVAILILAMGIGANTAMFSVVHAVLLKPLAYSEPDRIVTLATFWRADAHQSQVSGPDYHDWHDQSDAFESMASYNHQDTAVTVGTGSGATAEYAHAAAVTAEFFNVFAISPAAGREFSADELKPGSAGAAILSYTFAARHFGEAGDALGKPLHIAGKNLAIVGVMPLGFRFPEKTDVWIPVDAQEMGSSLRSAHNYKVVGRLRTGVTLEQAQAQMNAIGARIERKYPDSNSGLSVAVTRLRDQMVGDYRLTLYMMLAAVGVVLLIACANLANMLLAKAVGRAREIAIRAAVGASRIRIVRQLITESVVLALLAGGLGVALAFWGSRALVALAPADVPRLAEAGIDGRVLFFALGVSLAASLLFGLAPAMQVMRVDLNMALKQSAQRTGGGSLADHMRQALVVAEIALSVILVAGAGLLIKSFVALQNVSLGFQIEHVLVVETSVPSSDLESARRASRFYRDLLPRLRAIPGVLSAGATGAPPGDTRSDGGYYIDHLPATFNVSAPNAVYSVVAPDTFATVGIPLRAGRDFNEGDTYEAPFVAVINEALARQAFPNQDPIGHSIYCGLDSMNPMKIVGIVGNIRQYGPARDPSPEIYMPNEQHPQPATDLTLLMRTSMQPGTLSPAVREKIRELSPEVPVKFTTMEVLTSENIAVPRFRTLLLGIFAALAVCLALAGVYGVMSYVVGQRVNEIGLRMALGASQGDVLRLVLRQTVLMTGLGITVGLAGAAAVTQLLTSLLFGVKATDPGTYAAVVALLVLAALAASYIPARRAMRVDPMVALRYE
ncbi:MAG: ABC transporter permease [Candidatus Acidiferrum sp.]